MGLFQFMDANSEAPVPMETKSSEPQHNSELDYTGWWRRGRVEFHQQHGLAVLLAISWKRCPRSGMPGREMAGYLLFDVVSV